MFNTYGWKISPTTHINMKGPLTQTQLKTTYTQYFKQENFNKKCIIINYM